MAIPYAGADDPTEQLPRAGPECRAPERAGEPKTAR